MNDVDQKIQAALRRDVGSDAFSVEPNIAEEVLLAFRGRHRWLSSLLTMVTLAAFAGFVFAAVRFWNSADLTMQLRWAGAGSVLLLMVTALKLWFWLELQTNRILREVKRVELLLVSRPQK